MEIHHLISQRFEDFIFKKVSAMAGKNTGLRSMNKVAHPRFFVARDVRCSSFWGIKVQGLEGKERELYIGVEEMTFLRSAMIAYLCQMYSMTLS